ncbi:MAG: sialate O-acetylesterase [Kiritimatiellales bacterium]
MKIYCYIVFFIAVLSGAGLAQKLSVPTVFTDHAVLQRGMPVPVWGRAEPGAQISVEFAGQKKTTAASDGGKWRVTLDPMPASAKPQTMTIHSSLDTRPLSLSDVLIGEVWLCSGQSNMEMPMQGWPKWLLKDSDSEIAAADHPLIRLYKTPMFFSRMPTGKINAQWNVCSPDTVKTFSACAYYFGLKLHQDLDVPIGLLQSAWGGTRIEPWTPACGFDGIDSLADIRRQIHPMPELGADPQKDRQFPTALYNGMLAANVPFTIRGAIWYQGESNHNEGMLYVDKTRALLNGWHKMWGTDFPFYFVQLAPFQYGDPFLPEFWEAQSEIVKQISGTGMAVINDAAVPNNIHPSDKKTPGTRLALLAEANTYGMDVVSRGPVFKNMEIKDNTLVVAFDSAEGLTTRDGTAPNWFEIAGKDKVFRPARADIEGDCVILSSPSVPEPVMMRFAWNNRAMPNLINGAGLPASAFRAEK